MKPTKSPGTRPIRNSTAEFLIFTGQAGEQSIEARYEDETVWLSHTSGVGSSGGRCGSLRS